MTTCLILTDQGSTLSSVSWLMLNLGPFLSKHWWNTNIHHQRSSKFAGAAPRSVKKSWLVERGALFFRWSMLPSQKLTARTWSTGVGRWAYFWKGLPGATVDGNQKSHSQPPGMYQKPVNNGKNLDKLPISTGEWVNLPDFWLPSIINYVVFERPNKNLQGFSVEPTSARDAIKNSSGDSWPFSIS